MFPYGASAGKGGSIMEEKVSVMESGMGKHTDEDISALPEGQIGRAHV